MNKISCFLELLKGSAKIISQNGRLVAITATLYLILTSISFLLNTSSTKPFLVDFILKIYSLLSARPGTPEYTALLAGIREDIGIYLGIQTAYVLLNFFIVLFVKTAVIFISSCYFTGNNLSLRELILKVSRSWTRPFVTSFYVELLALGYTSFFFLPFLVPSLVLFDHHILLITILVFLAILFFIFYLYLYVVWGLALVVSVVEDSYGISALGNARELVKGNRLQGFLLNLFFILVTGLIFMFGFKLSPVMPILVGVVQVVFICIAGMFQTMAYTVLYFQCKNLKRIGSSAYSLIPAALDEDLP